MTWDQSLNQFDLRDNSGAANDVHRVRFHDNEALQHLINHHHLDARCSVCQSPARSWALMVPGRQDCPASFTLDYKGYLMAVRSHHTPPWPPRIVMSLGRI